MDWEGGGFFEGVVLGGDGVVVDGVTTSGGDSDGDDFGDGD